MMRKMDCAGEFRFIACDSKQRGRRAPDLVVLVDGCWNCVAARRARAAGGGTRRIDVLIALAADDPEGQARLVAFVQGLQESEIIRSYPQ
jgi:hypothetical protein